jgi:serine/threonine protein kinase
MRHNIKVTDKVFLKIEKINSVSDDSTAQARINQYFILEEIGKGAFGKVMKCKNEESGEHFACKILSKSRLKNKFRQTRSANQTNEHENIDDLRLGLVKREIAILKKLSKHPNINALIEVVDDVREDNLYMSKFFFFLLLLLNTLISF